MATTCAFSSQLVTTRTVNRPTTCCASSAHSEVAKLSPRPRAPKGWRMFCENVSGEWSGSSADFDHKGKLIPLASSLLPQEYAEWGVEVSDWETYCATLAKQNKRGGLTFYNKTMRLYPTVGCGSTTVSVYSTQEQTIEDETDEQTLAFHSSGAYVAYWKQANVIEHCLVDEREDGLRVRILNKLKASNFHEITIFREKWEDSFQSGKTVESCLTRHAGVATGPRLDAAELLGTWQTVTSSFSPVENSRAMNPVSFEKSDKLVRPQHRLKEPHIEGYIMLPEGLWTCVQTVGDEVHVEGGWLTSRGNAVVSRCKLTAAGKLQRFELETQYRNTKLDMPHRTFFLDADENN